MQSQTAAPPASFSDIGPRTRIRLSYLWRHGRLPNLNNPTRFTELVQARKLYDRDPRMAGWSDKVLAKELASAALGREWVVPTYWHGRSLPDAPSWAYPFMLKARHGCNWYAPILDRHADWKKISGRAQGWLGKRYGEWLDEWAYRDIEPGLLVEPFIGQAPELPIDYKLYVFDGEVHFIQVHLGRGSRHRWMQFDANWKRVSSQTAEPDPAPPHSLPAMVEAAATLGKNFDFVRIDFYEVAHQPLFGEMTFYPGSGYDPFDPVGLDMAIGARWLAARGGTYPGYEPDPFPAGAQPV